MISKIIFFKPILLKNQPAYLKSRSYKRWTVLKTCAFRIKKNMPSKMEVCWSLLSAVLVSLFVTGMSSFMPGSGAKSLACITYLGRIFWQHYFIMMPETFLLFARLSCYWYSYIECFFFLFFWSLFFSWDT